MHTIQNGVINDTVGDYSVIRAPTVSFITPFGMVCILHFYSVHIAMHDYFMIHPTPQCPCMYIAI